VANLFIWLGTLSVVIVVVIGVAKWASATSVGPRNCATFLMAAGASYCASFVVDMWAQAALDNMPARNVVMPSITWLTFALALGGGALAARGSAYAIGLPFALNALLALAVSGVHPQNLTVGLVLFLLAVIAVLLRRQTERKQLEASRAQPVA